MNKQLTILTSILFVSVFTLTGCNQVEETTENTETTTVEVNESVEEQESTIETGDDEVEEEVRSEENREAVLTSGYVRYESEDLGLSFEYPDLGSEVQYIVPGDEYEEPEEGSWTGWQSKPGGYYGDYTFTIAGSVSEDYAVGTHYSPTGIYTFEQREGVFYLNGDQEIASIEKTGYVDDQEYIIYKAGNVWPEYKNTDAERYGAMILFPENHHDEYVAFGITFPDPMTLEQAIHSIESVQFTKNAQVQKDFVDVLVEGYQEYESEELRLSFKYPALSTQAQYFEPDDGIEEAVEGEWSGWVYSNYSDTSQYIGQFVVASLVSQDYAIERDQGPIDVHNFEEREGFFYLNSNIQISSIEKTGYADGQQYVVYNAVNAWGSYKNTGLDTYGATVLLPENHHKKYKALNMVFMEPMTLEQAIHSIESVQFN